MESEFMTNLQNIFEEIEKHLLEDEKPSDYLNTLIDQSLDRKSVV